MKSIYHKKIIYSNIHMYIGICFMYKNNKIKINKILCIFGIKKPFYI